MLRVLVLRSATAARRGLRTAKFSGRNLSVRKPPDRGCAAYRPLIRREFLA